MSSLARRWDAAVKAFHTVPLLDRQVYLFFDGVEGSELKSKTLKL